MKFSVLIPAYNASKYIERCLDSLLSQTFQDFEIVVVDDGSKDDTLLKLHCYQSKDDRIRVYHQNNKGVAYTRNRLLDYAKGEWIAFVDADDYVSNEYLYRFEAEISTHTSSLVMVMSNHYIITHQGIGNGIKKRVQPKHIFDELLQKKYKDVPSVLWAKVFKRQLIIDRNIRFSGKFQMGEDLFFLVMALYNVTDISYIDIPLYYWDRTNENSMTRRKKIYHYDNIKCYDSIIEFITINHRDNSYYRSLNIGKMFLRHSDYCFKKRNKIKSNVVYADVVYENLSIADKMRLFCINNDLYFLLRLINRIF